MTWYTRKEIRKREQEEARVLRRTLSRKIIVKDSFCPSAFYNYPQGSIVVTRMPYRTEQGLSLQIGLVTPERFYAIEQDNQTIRGELLRARGKDFDPKNPEIRCYSEYDYPLFRPSFSIENVTVLKEMPPYKLFFSFKSPTTNGEDSRYIAERLRDSLHKSSTFKEFVMKWPVEVRNPPAREPIYDGGSIEFREEVRLDLDDLRILRDAELGF